MRDKEVCNDDGGIWSFGREDELEGEALQGHSKP